MAQTALQDLCQDLSFELPSVTWADDIAVPLGVRDARQLVPLVKQLVQFVYTLFAGYGFNLNFDKGKSSAVVDFRGKHSPELRRTFLLCEQPGVDCPIHDESSQWLHFVAAYKHLGTIYTADAAIHEEIGWRLGQAKAAFQSISRPFLCNRHLPLTIRLRLFGSLILSKLYFGMGAWSTPPETQLQRMRSALGGMLRKVLRLPTGEKNLSITEVLMRAGQPDVRARLALDRLRYAAQLFQRGPAFLHHNLHREFALTDDSWMRGLFADLAWLHHLCPEQVPSAWTSCLTEAIDRWQQPTSGWHSTLKRALRRFLLQEKHMIEVHRFHEQIWKELRAIGVRFSPDPLEGEPAVSQHFCFCGKGFETRRGLLAHQRKQHAIFSLERPFLTGVVCPVCLKYLWTTQRLQQHLAYIPASGEPNPCYSVLQRSGKTFDYDPQTFAPEVRGLSRRDALQMQGPTFDMTPAAHVHAHAADREIARLRDELDDFETPTNPDASPILGEILSKYTQTWIKRHAGLPSYDKDLVQDLQNIWLGKLSDFPEVFQTWSSAVFIKWGQHVLPDIIAETIDGVLEAMLDEAFAAAVADLPRYQLMLEIGYQEGRLRSHLRTLEEPDRPHRAHRRVEPRKRQSMSQEVPQLYEKQQEWLEFLHSCHLDEFPDNAHIPFYASPSGPAFYIVHLFSGRRRDFDVHHWIDWYATQKGLHVQVLSMDTAVSPSLGDLHHESHSWHYLLQLYRAQRVAASISGSPCETFSEARFTPAPPEYEGHRWPRPLRSKARLFGLQGLSFKEIRQMSQGSIFFLQTFYILVLHMRYGGIFLGEHPAPPQDPTRPSIWTAPLTKMLLYHYSLRLYVICQYKWGADATKPTGLITLNMPYFLRDLYSCADPQAVKPQSAAIGVDPQTKQFRTAAFKEYPARLCQGFAKAVLSQIDHQHRAQESRPAPEADVEAGCDEWLHEMIHASSQIHSTSHWLPDFQPR